MFLRPVYAELAALSALAFGLGIAAVPLDEADIEWVGGVFLLALLIMVGILAVWSGATSSNFRAALTGLLLLEGSALCVALGIGVQQSLAGELAWYYVPLVPPLFMVAYFGWWAAVPGIGIGILARFLERLTTRMRTSAKA